MFESDRPAEDKSTATQPTPNDRARRDDLGRTPGESTPDTDRSAAVAARWPDDEGRGHGEVY